MSSGLVVHNNSVSTEQAMNPIILLNTSKFAFQGTSLNIPSKNNISTPEKLQNNKSIFVCAFCQVFSSSNSAITEHIVEVHCDSIPKEDAASNYVSKLEELLGKCQTTCQRKVGRPRKILKKNSSPIEEKKACSEPVPRSDGLYWCDKCVKSFKKARQIRVHVCFEEEQEEDLDGLSSDCDSTSDYKIYMDVQPLPWSRKLKQKSNNQNLSENHTKIHSESISPLQESPPTKVKLHWRNDPEYVPLFPNENERIAFEHHVNSIDYSCVDHLFVKEETKIKSRCKKRLQRSVSSYSCILCKKKINSLTHIRMHCLIHTDVQPFTCPKCPYRSNTKGSLYTHMRNHTGNVFHCSHCSFQTVKRSHLLDHEETHSSVPQVCKLCKNSYKTLKSLYSHVRRCHDNPGGKKYIKSFSAKKSKECGIKCKICHKVFKSAASFELHNESEHIASSTLPPQIIEDTRINQESTNSQTISIGESLAMPENTFTDKILTVKDPLAEIVLNDLLQQKTSASIELYEDVFHQSSELLPPPENLTDNDLMSSTVHSLPELNGNSRLSPKGDLDECEKNLNLDLLNECLRNPNFAEEVMRGSYMNTSKLVNPSFNLHAPIDLTYSNESLIPSSIAENNLTHADVSKSSITEPKSAEIKLFEKCQRAPAYVCCVCQGIFICTTTLKAHLKEHVNSNSSLMEPAEELEQPKVSEASTAIDGVCSILQESNAENEKELEKLYSSSLDRMWYLPEVSVVLQNDPSLFDTLLDDISNFSIPDKYEETESLQVKCQDIFP